MAAALSLVLGSLAAVPAVAQSSVIMIPGLKIGVVGGDRPGPTAARLEPFRRYLGQEIGSSVELLTFKDGLTLVDAVATGKVNYAIFSASAYATASRICGCVEPVVAPRSSDGTVSYRAVLVARASSGFASVKDLKGKVLAAADMRSVAGRLVPFRGLAEAGTDPATHFARVETVNGPEAAMRLLLAGKADAALAWSTFEGEASAGYSRGTLKDLVDKRILAMADIQILWRSAAIPHGPHAVRSELPSDVKVRLRDALVHLREDDPVAYEAVEPEFGGGFTSITHGAYEPLLMLVGPKAKAGAEPDRGATGPAPPRT